MVPLPCPVGTYLLPFPVVGTSSSSCLPCTPGTYNNRTNFSAAATAGQEDGCTACPAGTLSEGLRATECARCPIGGYCSAVAAASVRQTYTPCPAGTYNGATGASDASSCVACAAGKASPIPGSSDASVCNDCLPGRCVYPPSPMPMHAQCARPMHTPNAHAQCATHAQCALHARCQTH